MAGGAARCHLEVPFAVYLLGVRTRVLSLAGGILLFAGSLWALIALFGNDGSTAGVGVLTLPFLLTVVAVLVVIADLHFRER